MDKLLKIARPQFLIVGLALFLLGALWAVLVGAPFSLMRLLLGYLVILPAQLSVHFSNDYFDVATDGPAGSTLISGGGGVLVEHPELRETAHQIAQALILFSVAIGILFLMLFSFPIWMMGFVALGNLVGWCYSAPPFRLSFRGLGELCYTFTAGFLITSMGYLVMKGSFDPDAIFFVVPLLFYGLASILSVEIPDVEVDRAGNKRTWVAQLGRGFGFTAIGLLLLAATGYFFIFPAIFPRPIPVDLHILGLFSLLPLGPGIFGLVKKPIERQLATRTATSIVISLAAFSILVDLYLVLLVARLVLPSTS